MKTQRKDLKISVLPEITATLVTPRKTIVPLKTLTIGKMNQYMIICTLSKSVFRSIR